MQDFLKIGALLLFSAVQNHGLKVLSVLSAMVQQSPQVPLGWGILRRGNGGSILMSIYATEGLDHSEQESNTQRMNCISQFQVSWLIRGLFSSLLSDAN